MDIADGGRLAHVKFLAGEVRDPFQGECLPDLKLQPTIHLLDRGDRCLGALPLRGKIEDHRPLP